MRRQLFFQERTVYADPAAGYATLAASVLVEVVNDLESTNPQRRAHARLPDAPRRQSTPERASSLRGAALYIPSLGGRVLPPPPARGVRL
jgi:hypothetical protein